MPATIRTVFESTKPVADAARPVNALRSEITTGMSAPPIGSTNRIPKSSASPTRSHSTHWSCTPATSATPRATVASRTAMLKMFWPGNVIGRPLRSSCSFAKAIIEPANEIEPISAESTVETEAVVARPAVAMWNSASATSAAAPPPTPLNRATICGIAVIFTVRAPTRPTAGADHAGDDDQRPVADAVEQQRARRSRGSCRRRRSSSRAARAWARRGSAARR